MHRNCPSKPGLLHPLLAWLGITLLAIASVAAQEVDLAGPMDLTQEGIARRIETLRPAIEEALGSKFDAPLVVLATCADDLATLVYEEGLNLRGSFRTGSLKGLRHTFHKEADTLSRAVLGKVALRDGTIHIAPETFDQLPFRRGLGDKKLTQGFLDLILVHEAVHVWQDRRHGVARLFGVPKSLEEVWTLMAVTEGHAEWVLARFAADPRYDAARNEYARILDGFDKDSGGHEFLRGFEDLFKSMVRFPYIKGHEFMKAVERSVGRAEAERLVFERSPRLIKYIHDPAAYVAGSGTLATPAAQEPERVVRTGRIELPESASAPKSVTINFWPVGEPFRPLAIDAPGGEFSFHAPKGVELRLGLVVVDGVTHDEVAGETIASDIFAPIVIALETRRSYTIAVLDAVTQEPLAGAEFWVLPDEILDPEDARDLVLDPWEIKNEMPRPMRPDGTAVVRRQSASDVVIVRARDHVWARVPIPASPEAPITIRLGRAGSLRLKVEHAARLFELVVDTRYLRKSLNGEFDLDYGEDLGSPDKDGVLVVPHLPPGLHVITARRNSRHVNGIVYASDTVNIIAGAEASLTLTPNSIPETRSLELRLVLPEAWSESGDPDFVLDGIGEAAGVQLEGEFRAIEDRSGLTSRIGQVIPGKYELSFTNLQCVVPLTVPAGKDAPIEIKLPPPERTRFRVVDEETGEPIRGGSVRWHLDAGTEDSRGARSVTPRVTRLRAGDETVTLVSGPGVLSTTFEAEGHQPASKEVRAGGSAEPTTVRLAPAGRVVVILKHDGKPYVEPVTVTLTPTGVPDAGENILVDQTGFGGRLVLKSVPPGTHLVTFSPIENFLPIDARNVTVTAREKTELVVDLVREKRLR